MGIFGGKKEPGMPNPKKSGKKLEKINKKISKRQAKTLKKKEWARMKSEVEETSGSLYWDCCGRNALVVSPDHHAQVCDNG